MSRDVVSKSKFMLDDETIKKLFSKAGIDNISSISPLGAGEFNAVYEVIADKAYVLKVAPDPKRPTQTYEKNMMRSEVHWYCVMREKTNLNVPEVYFSDFSRELVPTDYFIMEKIEGTQKDCTEMSEEEKKDAPLETVRMVSQLHAVSNDKFGYIQSGLYDNWYLALRGIANDLLDDGKRMGKNSRRGKKFIRFIDKNKEIFEKVECCLINFDIWDPNFMCTRDESGKLRYTWIDPERCFWGDRVLDFLCIGMMSPLEKQGEIIKAYNSVAKMPVEVNDETIVRYAAALGLLALIMEVERYYRCTLKSPIYWRNTVSAAYLYSQAFASFKKHGKK